MKKVLIYAYNRLNLGDDLFVKILCDRYPKTKFIIICPKKYSIAYKNINNLTCKSFDSIFERIINLIFRKIGIKNFLLNYNQKKSDASVTIGGSIFIQGEKWENRIIEFVERTKYGKPCYILGANFGPFNDNKFLNEYKNLFNKYADVCLRDKYSYYLFNKNKNVRYAPDIIFKLSNDNEKRGNTVIISVINPSSRTRLRKYDNEYCEKIKEICIKIIDSNLNVKLVSFCKDEGDEEAIKNIIDRTPNYYRNKIDKYFYNGNINEILKIIAESHSVVATRFHAMILGLAYNKSVYSIAYSNKMENVIYDVNNNIPYMKLEDINKLSIENVINVLKNEPIKISGVKVEANNHFLKLDKYLLNQ